MLNFEEQLRQLEEQDEWTARVLGRFQLAWADIERDIRTLWLMRVGENEFRRQDTQTLQERRKRLPGQKFQKLVKCTVPDRELQAFWLFPEHWLIPEHLRESPKFTVPGGNLHTWLLDNWPTRNLVIHGCLGQKIDFSGPSIPFISDADEMAMMLAAEPGENTVSFREWIDVEDLVPLTEEAQQVKFHLMQVHRMVLHNGVSCFPLRDPA
ncbi:MAG: hypothetical protein OXM58_11825 [Rhodospirillaceae bacterium]|nr:hypothetical protein [Rhodospirillaceae bacterium]MDE0619323.1 hypothetical protein [Rhodospirillaceae bacterium]